MPMPPINKRAAAGVMASAIALAAAFISAHEGKRNHAYADAVGIPTVCYGHTADVHLGQTQTDEECVVLLDGDLNEAAQAITHAVTVPLTANQRAALISFVFNIGTEAFQQSRLLRKLNTRDYQGAADELLRWDHAGGKVLPGLSKRRAAERALFLGQINPAKSM